MVFEKKPAQRWIAFVLAFLLTLSVANFSFVLTANAADSSSFELPVVGATAYPAFHIDLYEKIGKQGNNVQIDAGTPLQILKEETNSGNVYWKVRTKDNRVGWVEADGCMINLPDVIPSIVYNDTNAYSSLFKSMDENIDGVTGTAMYSSKSQNERLQKEEFNMPVFYTTAIKLAEAQKRALADGEALVLYQAYRPSVCQDKVNAAVKAITSNYEQALTAGKLDSLDAKTKKIGDALITSDGQGGSWYKGWGWFIANGLSNHQYGYAVDVSLAKINSDETKTINDQSVKLHNISDVTDYWEEGYMPSDMHSLDPRGATTVSDGRSVYGGDGKASPNGSFSSGVASLKLFHDNWSNEMRSSFYAQKLQQIMLGDVTANRAFFDDKFAPLASEWWHFNDIQTQNDILQGKYSVNRSSDSLSDNKAKGIGQWVPSENLSVDPKNVIDEEEHLNPQESPSTSPDPSTSTNPGSSTDPGPSASSGGGGGTTPSTNPGGGGTGGETPGGGGGTGGGTGGDHAIELPKGDGKVEAVVFKKGVDGKLLKDATFTFVALGTGDISGSGTVATYSTNSEGEIRLQWTDPSKANYVPPGVYTVYEVRPPLGYNLDNQGPQTLILEWDGTKKSQNGPLTFTNSKRPALIVEKIDSTTKAGLAGAYFDVWRDNKYLGTIGPTNAEGRIIFDGDKNTDGPITEGYLPNGHYVFKEKLAPSGYLLSEDIVAIDINVGNDDGLAAAPEAPIVHFEDDPYPKITIKKVDANDHSKGIPGAIFQIYINDHAFRQQYETNKSGEIVIDYETYKHYLDPEDPTDGWEITVTEITAPHAYNLDIQDTGTYTQSEFLNKGQSEAVEFLFVDSPYKSIHVHKRDDQGKPVAGATFLLKSLQLDNGADNGISMTLTTDSNGDCTFTLLPNGTYEITEQVPADGYMLAKEKAYVTLTTNNVDGDVTFTDYAFPTIVIMKEDAADFHGLPGAMFSVKINGIEVGNQLTTGPDGKVTINYATYGHLLGTTPPDEGWTVVVDELKAPGGYNKDRTDAGNYTQTKSFDRGTGTVTFEFVDTAYKNYKVIVKDTDGKPVKGAIVHLQSVTLDNGESYDMTVETDANGVAEFKGLPNGVYRVTESASDNYLGTNTTVFEITSDPADKTLYTNEFTHETLKKIIIDKKNRDTGTPAPGAEFEISVEGKGIAGQFITDANGQIIIDYAKYKMYLGDSERGTWTVSVREVKAPGGFNLDEPGVVTQEFSSGSDLVFNFTDTPYRSIKVHKTDNTSEKPVEGATFRLHSVEGYIPDIELTTDANGDLTFHDIPNGHYVITEVSSPGGYVGEGQSVEIEITSSSPPENLVTFSDYVYPVIRVYKYDARTRQPLAGAMFDIAIGGKVIAPDEVTNKDGYIELSYETYHQFLGDTTPEGGWNVTVTEKSAPGGYNLDKQLDGTYVQTQMIKPGTTAVNFQFFDTEYKQYKVYVVDQNNNPVPGATVELKSVELENGGSFNMTVQTDENGCADFGKIPNGTYEITEYASDNYLGTNTFTRRITSEPVSETVVTDTVSHKTVPTITIWKYNDDTNEPLAGATFEVQVDGVPVGSQFVTDENGKIVISYDDYKMYLGNDSERDKWIVSVRELKAPDHFNLDDTTVHSSETDGDEPIEFQFYDTPFRSIRVHKNDDVTDEPIEGTVFELESVEGLVNKMSIATGPDGTLIFPDLPNGHYIIREVSVTGGYVGEGQTMDVYVRSTDDPIIDVYFTDYAYPTITIYKLDRDDGKTPLEGAAYDVIINGQYIAKNVPTDENGRVVLNYEDYRQFLGDIEPEHGWTIQVTETKAPGYYNIDGGITQEQTIGVGQSNVEFYFYNAHYRDVIVHLTDVDWNPLEGGTFKLHAESLEDDSLVFADRYLTTDENGTLTFEDVPNGVYKLSQVIAAEGYTMSTKEVTVVVTSERTEFYEEYTYYFINYIYPTITIIKRDKDTKEPLEGAVFNIRIDGSDFQTQRSTGKDGKIVLTYDEFGEYLNGTVSPSHGWTVTVTEVRPPELYNRDLQEGNTYTQTENLLETNKDLEFIFYNTHYKSIRVWKYDSEMHWPLAGATFHLHCESLEDIAHGGNIVDREFTTDATGNVLFEDLPNGTYTITEVHEPYGYHGNDESHTIVLSNETRYLIIEDEFYNEPKSGIFIRKIDSLTKQPLANVRFEIIPQTPLTESSWEETTDDNGNIVLENLPEGTYIIREVATVDGYILDTTPRTVQVDAEHQATTVIFENNQKSGLNILKLDSATNEPLGGSVFEVRTASGEVIATLTTGSNGYATLTDLKPGHYIVQEIKAPAGHMVDPNPQMFDVKETDSGVIYMLVFGNSTYPSLFIRKYDETNGIGLAGAHFNVWHNDTLVGNDLITNEEGFIQMPNIDVGTYTVQEIQAPDGYLLNDEKYSITLEANGTYVLGVPNNKQGTLRIHKTDSVTGENLPGAEFELRASDGSVIGRQLSDSEGYATWTGLKPDTYQIVETIAPQGYVLDEQPRVVTINANDSALIEWPNTVLSSVVVIKKDSATDLPLAGARFDVRTMDGRTIETITSDASGMAKIEGLEPGRYNIVEIAAPPGYLLDSSDHYIEVTPNKMVEIEILNERMKSITIHKVDANDNKPLAGAVMEVVDQDGNVLGSYTTDPTGTITTDVLAPGTYYVREVVAPEGYVLDPTEHEVIIASDRTADIIIPNTPKSIIQILKTDAITGNPLAGAEFEIRNHDGTTIEVVTTDVTGWAYSKTLDPGDYVVVETKAPDGYSLDPTENRVTVVQGENVTLKLTNSPGVALHITKIDSVTREPLPGAVFELRYDTGHGDCVYIGTYTTDEFGMIHTEILEPGFYMVKEIKAPDGYAISTEEYRYCVKAGEYNHLVVEDIPLGSIIIRKLDLNKAPVAGAVFKVENADTMDLVGLFTTDANGEAVVAGLKAGFYIATEVQAPDGHQLDPIPKTIQVEDGKTSYAEFYDAANGSLIITLQDQNTFQYLYGGHFVVIRESDQIVVYDGSTDITGTIVIGDLVPGWYTVTQDYPPDKYTIGDKQLKVEVTSGGQAILHFFDYTAGLIIEKIDAMNPAKMLPGARFKVENEQHIVVGEYVTGASGTVEVGGLSDGLYTITELVSPLGYALNTEPQVVHVRAGTVGHATFLDTALSSITIRTLDKVSRAPIPGVRVEVWKQNGVMINSYVSDTTGIIQTDHLPAGYYVLKVVYIPDGYTLDTKEATVQLVDGIETTYTFEFDSKSVLKVVSMDSEGKAIAGMRFTVTTIDGTIVGEYVTGNDGTYLLDNLVPGWYIVTEKTAPNGFEMAAEKEVMVEVKTGVIAEVVFKHGTVVGLQLIAVCKDTGKRMAGVEFEVRELDERLIGTYTTDSDGIVFVPLGANTYTVKVKTVPQGYAIVGEEMRTVDVMLNQLTSETFEFTALSSIRVQVVDGRTNKPIYGVRLQVEQNGEIIKEIYSDNMGYIEIDSSLKSGGYDLVMISAPDGYIVDSRPHPIDVLVQSTTEVVWKLYQEGGQIQVEVRSADYNEALNKKAGSLLQGAVFEVLDEYTLQVVGEIISDNTGIAASSALPLGRYIIRMITPPPYYSLNSTWEPEFELFVNNDIIRLSVDVQSITLDTAIDIKSNTTATAGTNVRVDVLEAASKSDVRLDYFNFHLKIPTDAARAVTLNTGVWSHELFYTITFKTNMNDYRTLADNLISSENHQYGLSSEALGLKSGEYVTDVRFEFGTVPANFHLVQGLAYTEYILSTVYDGYIMINRAEVTGQYNATKVSTSGTDNSNPYSQSGASLLDTGGYNSPVVDGNSGYWIGMAGQWSSTIKSNIKNPDKLPTTGY